MSLTDLTKASVELAMKEFDDLGRSAFLSKYGFGQSTKYFLVHSGVAYDSKAICGAAHRWVSPDQQPMTAEEFSGGDKTVAARLTKLGFHVITTPIRLQISDAHGEPLNSTCELHRSGAGFTLTLHSAGGGTTPRNPDYVKALQTVLQRLAQEGAHLDSVLLDSRETRHLDEVERQLIAAAPLKMTEATNVDELVTSIKKHSASISVDPAKKSGGNSTKQIQLLFTVPHLTTVDSVKSQIIHGGQQTFILTWNPKVFLISDTDIEASIRASESGTRQSGYWGTGSRRSGIKPGDHLYLFRQQSERGIIAHAIATSGIWQGPHFNNPDRQANYVNLEWTRWVSTDDRLPVEDLHTLAPETDWNAIFGSGIQLHSTDATALAAHWTNIQSGASAPRTGDEGVEGLPEGARKSVVVNKYERNRSARDKALWHHGTACKVCEIDFADAYSGIADGIIHVHHVVPLASIGAEYRLNPVKDLVPVCPNCHAMLHYRVKQPRTVDELRALLNGDRFPHPG